MQTVTLKTGLYGYSQRVHNYYVIMTGVWLVLA